MNLQKEISFGAPKRVDYPVKTDINLMKAEVTRGNTLVNILLFLVFLVLLALFVKFAVADPLSTGMQSSQALTAAQAKLDALKAENASYTELNQEYSKYILDGLTEEEMNLVDRNDLLDLLSETVMRVTFVSGVKVVGNSVAISCIGVDLQYLSEVVRILDHDERVAYATVSAAQEEDGALLAATIQIVLKEASAAEADDEAGQSSPPSDSSGVDLAGALGVTSSAGGASDEN